jgi:hypothetical protein
MDTTTDTFKLHQEVILWEEFTIPADSKEHDALDRGRTFSRRRLYAFQEAISVATERARQDGLDVHSVVSCTLQGEVAWTYYVTLAINDNRPPAP